MQIDLNALALFAESTLDCNDEYEEDEFAFTFDGERIYCVRHRHYFKMELEGKVLELPR